MKHNYLKKSFDFNAALNLIDSLTHAAAVTALVVGSSFAFACFMAWLFGVL